jgi:hypothetical protein
VVGKHEGHENARGCGMIRMLVSAESVDSSCATDEVVSTMKDHESHETAHTCCPMSLRR